MTDKLEQKLLSKNIKPTPVRKLVLKKLLEERVAMSLVEIERKLERIDRSSIYRTLRTFEENYLVHAIPDRNGTVRYAVCDDACTCEPRHLHLHFLCLQCNKTYCLTDNPVQIPDLPPGYEVRSADFLIKGICPSCNK